MLGVQVLLTYSFASKRKKVSEFVNAKSVRSDFHFGVKNRVKKACFFEKNSVALKINTKMRTLRFPQFFVSSRVLSLVEANGFERLASTTF